MAGVKSQHACVNTVPTNTMSTLNMKEGNLPLVTTVLNTGTRPSVESS